MRYGKKMKKGKKMRGGMMGMAPDKKGKSKKGGGKKAMSREHRIKLAEDAMGDTEF